MEIMRINGGGVNNKIDGVSTTSGRARNHNLSAMNC